MAGASVTDLMLPRRRVCTVGSDFCPHWKQVLSFDHPCGYQWFLSVGPPILQSFPNLSTPHPLPHPIHMPVAATLAVPWWSPTLRRGGPLGPVFTSVAGIKALGRGQATIGGDFELTVGPVGRDVKVPPPSPVAVHKMERSPSQSISPTCYHTRRTGFTSVTDQLDTTVAKF